MVDAVDARQHRYAHLIRFGMAEKGAARPAAVGIKFLLFGKFDAAVIDQLFQRDIEPFEKIGNLQYLSGWPAS
jgi:hypothetical protein